MNYLGLLLCLGGGGPLSVWRCTSQLSPVNLAPIFSPPLRGCTCTPGYAYGLPHRYGDGERSSFPSGSAEPKRVRGRSLAAKTSRPIQYIWPSAFWCCSQLQLALTAEYQIVIQFLKGVKLLTSHQPKLWPN